MIYDKWVNIIPNRLCVSYGKEMRLKIIEELRNLFLEVLGLVEVMLENNEKEEYIKEFDKIVKQGEM